MDSWRDTTSAMAQDDLDDLLGLVMPLAEELLGKHGEFFPFGGSVSTDGAASLAAADPGLGENPESTQVLANLYEGARANSTGERAFAFVADVRAISTDAVRVELEHREGVALLVLLPYKRSRFKKTLTFGEMAVAEGERRVWGDLGTS